jgi:phage terminase Nu1 subunit (DNA packaging protein)
MDEIPAGLPPIFTAAQMRYLTGLTYARLEQLGEAGVINRIAKGQYAPDSVVRYIKFQRESAAGPSDLRAVRVELMKERLAMAKLDRAAREGKLVPVDDMIAVNTTIARKIQTRLLAVPAATAPRLVELRHAADAEAILRPMIEVALEELAGLQVVLAGNGAPRRRNGRNGHAHGGDDDHVSA